MTDSFYAEDLLLLLLLWLKVVVTAIQLTISNACPTGKLLQAALRVESLPMTL